MSLDTTAMITDRLSPVPSMGYPSQKEVRSLSLVNNNNNRLSASDAMLEHSSRQDHRVKTSIGSWLRERAKLFPRHRTKSQESTTPSSRGDRHLMLLKPWKKFGFSRRHHHHEEQNTLCHRELPPLPTTLDEGDQADRMNLSSEKNGDLSDVTHRTNSLPKGTQSCTDAIITDKPDEPTHSNEAITSNLEFSKSLEAVKRCGWYWGPISGEAAEKLLASEPDGSFIVRDSSADHYIFSLTFKLNGTVRHVRIEHNQGNFSFGTGTTFKGHTIVDFVENAVEHSRSGRFLFFLHRRPVLGPMRVQLLHPVSRFKSVQSLQHQCRFVILRHVPRDLLHKLPVPPKIQEYLNTPFYYSEIMADSEEKYNDQSP